MLVLNPNNIKIYNLSCGKSLPEWLSEKKRRLTQKKDVKCSKSIELIQDFSMPGVSTGIKVSRDGQYIVASGIYKPRVRCYDVKERSMKFERCFDSECVTFELLSDDYSKVVLLLSDRTVEFHAPYGRYYRTRIPKFGRDMTYHFQYCDLYFAGASSQVYRLNLEQGKYLSSLQTSASSVNKCTINPVHHLLACGTTEGKVEAWDPRSRNRIGILDCVVSSITEDTEMNEIPSVTALKFRDGVTMAVGTATGKVLLYDIRSHKPFLVKDHMYGLPIKCIDFIEGEELVASLDSKCVKFWDKNNGKPFTTIQPMSELNDVCIVPNTGLLFLANEDKQILTYYIPSIGPAPQWCHYLDIVVEQLEESPHQTVYDDYKFVTKKELEDLGLSHLFGSNLLRAYMHGYFMDIRLYNKAKAIVEPFAYKDFQKKKIREKIDTERSNRVKIKKLPKVNAEYALNKLMESNAKDKLNQKTYPSVLEDVRFKALFEDPEYTRDETSEEYKLLKPLIMMHEKKKKASVVPTKEFELVEDEDASMESASSSDDEESISNEEQIVNVKNNKPGKTYIKHNTGSKAKSKPLFYQIKDSEKFTSLTKGTSETKNEKVLSLGERLHNVKEAVSHDSSAGNKTVTFTLKKSESAKVKEEQDKSHRQERAQLHRPMKKLRNTARF